MREILRRGIEFGLSATEVTTSLIQKGLSYNRQNMLSDIRQSWGYETSSNDAARARFETWYTTKFEPFRIYSDIENKIKRPSALSGELTGKIVKAYQQGGTIPEELRDLVDEWEVIDEENPSPWKEE